MQPSLPPELQLYILELAIPLLTRTHLAEFRKLMRTWPLVSRAWRTWAYEKVPVVPRLALPDDKPGSTTLVHFLNIVAFSGRTVKRFEIILDSGKYSYSELLDRLHDIHEPVEQLWLTSGGFHIEWLFSFSQLCRLSPAPAGSHPIPPPLTHLTVHHITFDLDVTLPHLDTLVLESSIMFNMPPRLLPRVPSLRILVLDRSYVNGTEAFLAQGNAYPPTLQHIVLSDSFEQNFDGLPLPPFSFPSSLKSITCRYESNMDGAFRTSASLRTACAGTETEYIEMVYDKDDPLETAFDAEAWALSVGA
ncbi:hypothetical protein JCM3770_005528 [Rhodotorula araucariae]